MAFVLVAEEVYEYLFFWRYASIQEITW